MPAKNPGDPVLTPHRVRTDTPALAPIRVGAVSRGGEERRFGVVLRAGLADPTGMGARGCNVPITARSLLVWRLALSSPLPPLVRSRRALLPIYAGIGPILRGPAAIGTIADVTTPGSRRAFCEAAGAG